MSKETVRFRMIFLLAKAILFRQRIVINVGIEEKTLILGLNLREMVVLLFKILFNIDCTWNVKEILCFYTIIKNEFKPSKNE